MGRRIRTHIATLFAFLALSTALAMPSASAHPTVDLWCESGGGIYICSLSYSGAHEPVTTRWYRDGSHIPAWDNLTSVQQSCAIGVYYNFSAVVTDVHGSGQDSYRVLCRRIWQ